MFSWFFPTPKTPVENKKCMILYYAPFCPKNLDLLERWLVAVGSPTTLPENVRRAWSFRTVNCMSSLEFEDPPSCITTLPALVGVAHNGALEWCMNGDCISDGMDSHLKSLGIELPCNQ